MDTTFATENKFLKFENKEKAQDEKFLRDIAKFVKEELLLRFLNDFSR